MSHREFAAARRQTGVEGEDDPNEMDDFVEDDEMDAEGEYAS